MATSNVVYNSSVQVGGGDAYEILVIQLGMERHGTAWFAQPGRRDIVHRENYIIASIQKKTKASMKATEYLLSAILVPLITFGLVLLCMSMVSEYQHYTQQAAVAALFTIGLIGCCSCCRMSAERQSTLK